MSGELVAGFTFSGATPAPWLKEISGAKVTQWSNGTHYVSVNINSNDCDQLLSRLANGTMRPTKLTFGLYTQPNWWEELDGDWVGAVLNSDDYVSVADESEFAVRFPRPCLGIVAQNAPICVSQVPQNEVVSTRFETLFSVDVFRLICSHSSCVSGEVYFRNKPRNSHVRLFPSLSLDLLAKETMDLFPCAACGTQIRSHVGVMLGRRVEEFMICRNENAVGHKDSEYPVLFSLQLVKLLKRRYPRGFGFEPILDISSFAGQRICNIRNRIALLG